MILPKTLLHTGRELVNSSEIRDTTASTERGTANVLQGLVAPVGDSRLDNGVTDPDAGTAHAGSTTTWYLASANGHTVEVAYLRGTGRGPTIRSFALDRGQWGVGWDVKMDIGVKALDYRALVKNTA